ncbi:MAG: hypothetical protein MK080_10450 [Opitutales bacterium]|nr:hypothetical protein [Opitutales bacterium]NRA28126.1 hypothetical protein [Opitutales bacterium]
MFSWPTELVNRGPETLNIPVEVGSWEELDDLWELADYNHSENKAYLSAPGLKSLLHSLRDRFTGTIGVLGNVVVSEALRRSAVDGSGFIADYYVASQAATIADMYASGLDASTA